MADHMGEQRFEPEAKCAGEARHFLRGALDSVNVADPPLETAILLASELVTNAFLHARTEIVVRYAVQPTVVRVEVTDGNTRRPSAADVPRDATAGRALAIVDALATRWGVDAVKDGKSVWFELPITPRRRPSWARGSQHRGWRRPGRR